MRFGTRGSLFSAFALLSLAPIASQAETITFDFTGHVTSVYDPFGLVASLITTGDPVLASLRYDTTTPDLYPADPTRGAYLNTPRLAEGRHRRIGLRENAHRGGSGCSPWLCGRYSATGVASSG